MSKAEKWGVGTERVIFLGIIFWRKVMSSLWKRRGRGERGEVKGNLGLVGLLRG